MQTTYVEFPFIFNGLELEMKQGFKVFGLEIRWYAILIVIGIILAFIFAVRNSKRFGIKGDDFYDAILIGIPVGIIGARAFYVIFSSTTYTSFWDVINITEGGLAFYGALIAVALIAPIFAKIKKINLLALMDIVVMGFLLAQAIGRWGNFVNGEAYGCYTQLPWAMYIDGVFAHPTFLYESLFNIIGFIGMYIFLVKSKDRFNGEILCFYFIWSGATRGVVEWFRTDSLYWGDLKVSMVIGFAMCIIGIIWLTSMLIYRKKKGIHGLPEYPNYVEAVKAEVTEEAVVSDYESIIDNDTDDMTDGESSVAEKIDDGKDRNEE